jgi:diguanylate cyclase (GGDEF)-like protein
MEIRLILAVALAIIGCGCFGLLLVRITNPFLDGLGWLAASYGCGTVASLLLMFDSRIPIFWGNIVANGITLFAYGCVHAAVLELTDSKTRFSRCSLILLGAWLPLGLIFTYVWVSDPLFIASINIFVVAQVLQTLAVLLRHAVRNLRAPIWFSALVLASFAAFNIFRSIVILSRGSLHVVYPPSPLELLATCVYLGTALGVGFGFFWMSTAKLRVTLDRLASTDPLTGVWNRRVFQQCCDTEMSRSLRSGERFSMLICDIDHFKHVNDRFGHLVGDAVLRSIANCAQTQIRPGDTLGRWGGEEFVVLLPNCPAKAALEIADRLRQCVAALSTPSAPSGPAVQVTLSLGLATFRGPRDSLDDVLRRADAALYDAKSAGRNRVQSAA